MSMTIGKWKNKSHNMAILSKHGSMVLANLNFFKWINSRHSISGRRKNKFPTLVFLLTKCFSILQSFPSNKNFFCSINMLPRISIRIIEDRTKKGPSRSCSFFVHPDFYLPECRSHSDFEITSPLSKPLHDDHKAHISGKGMPWIGHETIDLRSAPFHRSRYPSSDTHFNDGRSEMTSGKTPVIRLWQIPSAIAPQLSKPLHDDHKARISGKGMPWIGQEPVDEKGTIRHSVSDSSIPILHYHNPSEAVLDDLKKSVAGIEKKVAERESFIEKYGSENLSISHKESDIGNKADINMSYLTDQIYQMLGRKIAIERERRGLYG